MSKLPFQLPQRLLNDTPCHRIISAYDMCLKLEQITQDKIDTNAIVGPRDMIYCRILGYLIHYAPTDQALKTVMYDIVSRTSEQALLDVGQVFYDYFISACTSFLFLLSLSFSCLQFDPKDRLPILVITHHVLLLMQ